MNFLEFLDAVGCHNLTEIIENADLDMMSVFHEQLMEWLKYYMVVGGMPEAVEIFADTYPGADFNRIMQVQEDILQAIAVIFEVCRCDAEGIFLAPCTGLGFNSLPACA